MRTYTAWPNKSGGFLYFYTTKNASMADNKNSGVLFRNDKMATEQHPDYTGNITIEGKEFYLSAWVNESARTGQKYFALKATPKAATTPATTTAPAQPATTIPDPVDDLPF